MCEESRISMCLQILVYDEFDRDKEEIEWLFGAIKGFSLNGKFKSSETTGSEARFKLNKFVCVWVRIRVKEKS